MASHSAYPTLYTFADGSRLCRHPNGTIYHHSRGKNGTGRQTTGRQTVDEALAVVRKWEVMAAQVSMDDKKLVTVDTIADAYTRWLRQNGRTACQEPFLRVMSRYLGEVPVCLLNAERIEAYLAWRRQGNGARSPTTWTRKKLTRGRPTDGSLYREISVLESMLRWAHENDLVPPETKLKFPKGQQSPAREVFLEQDEMADLLARAAQTSAGLPRLTRVHRFTYLALYTGARCEALEQLEWSQVDFARRVIHLKPPGRRATKKRRPSVPILDELLPVLLAARGEAISKYVLDGGAIRGSWQPFVQSTPYYADRDLHVHDLRRSFFTMLVTNGMPLSDISLTYEVSMAVLMRHYAKYASNLGARVAGYATVRPAALSEGAQA